MNDMIVEKLIQKVIAVIEGNMDTNLLVRALPPSAEMMSRLDARMEAMQSSWAKIEKTISKDNETIKELRIQSDQIQSAVKGQANEIALLKQSFDKSFTFMINHLNDEKSARQQQAQQFEQQLEQKLENIAFQLLIGKWLIFVLGCILLVCIIKTFS